MYPFKCGICKKEIKEKEIMAQAKIYNYGFVTPMGKNEAGEDCGFMLNCLNDEIHLIFNICGNCWDIKEIIKNNPTLPKYEYLEKFL